MSKYVSMWACEQMDHLYGCVCQHTHTVQYTQTYRLLLSVWKYCIDCFIIILLSFERFDKIWYLPSFHSYFDNYWNYDLSLIACVTNSGYHGSFAHTHVQLYIHTQHAHLTCTCTCTQILANRYIYIYSYIVGY